MQPVDVTEEYVQSDSSLNDNCMIRQLQIYKGQELWVDEDSQRAFSLSNEGSVSFAIWTNISQTIWDTLQEAPLHEIQLGHFNYRFMTVSPNFIMFLSEHTDSHLVIMSFPIEQLFELSPIEEVSNFLTLALDLGMSDAKSFHFDEEKAALFINFSDLVIVRKCLLEHETSEIETVFTLDNVDNDQTIQTFSVHNIDKVNTLLAIVLTPSKCLLLFKLDHETKTMMSLQLDVSAQVQTNELPLMFFEHSQFLLTSNLGAVIFRIDFDTMQLLNTTLLNETPLSQIIPLTLRLNNETFRIPCSMNQIHSEINNSSEMTLVKPSVSETSNNSLIIHPTSSIISTFQDFLKIRDQQAPIIDQQQQPILKRNGSRSKFIRELQEQTNMMQEKIKKVEQRRRLQQSKENNHQEKRVKEQYLSAVKLQKMVYIFQKFCIYSGLKEIKRHCKEIQQIQKAFGKLNKLQKRNTIRIMSYVFQEIVKTAQLRKIEEQSKQTNDAQLELERQTQKFIFTFQNLSRKIDYMKVGQAFKEVRQYSLQKKAQTRFHNVGAKIVLRILKAKDSKDLKSCFSLWEYYCKQHSIKNQSKNRFQPVGNDFENDYSLDGKVEHSQKLDLNVIKYHRKRISTKLQSIKVSPKVILVEDYEEEQTTSQILEDDTKNYFKRPGHRPSQLSISQIVAKSQEEQQDHQTLDDEEDQALFQKLFEKYHQELQEKQGPNSYQRQNNHARSQSSSNEQPYINLFSPSANSNCNLISQEDNIEGRSPNRVFDYLQNIEVPSIYVQHAKSLSSQYEVDGLAIPFKNRDLRFQSLNDDKFAHMKFIDSENQARFDNFVSSGDNQLIMIDQERKDFSFSIDQERGPGVNGVVASNHIMIPSKSPARKHSILQSRNTHNDPGLMLLNSKQERELVALNELNDILNEKINVGINQRDERLTTQEDAGYYETLGSHRLAFNNVQLEQETANFNREDWIGNQFRSASSRSNNHLRAETKNSVNSRLSTVHQANMMDNKISLFQGAVQVSTQVQETHECEDRLFTLQNNRSPDNLQSPKKVQYDPLSMFALQDFYKGKEDESYEQENTQIIHESQSPLALMHHSHYANFSQDFISPDNPSRKSSRIQVSAVKIMSNMNVNTPQSNKKLNKLDTSGATTPAQQSAFEMFRIRLHANLQNLRSHSQSRALDLTDSQLLLMDDNNNCSIEFKRHHPSRSQSQSISISEIRDEGFHSKRISLNFNNQSAYPPLRQIELKKITSSPIKANEYSREYTGLISNSVYQQLHAADVPDTTDCLELENNDHDNTMRYVEPFTQRASLANLELAEPVEIGCIQSSQMNDTAQSNIDEISDIKDKQSPFRQSYNGSPQKRYERDYQNEGNLFEAINIDIQNNICDEFTVEHMEHFGSQKHNSPPQFKKANIPVMQYQLTRSQMTQSLMEPQTSNIPKIIENIREHRNTIYDLPEEYEQLTYHHFGDTFKALPDQQPILQQPTIYKTDFFGNLTKKTVSSKKPQSMGGSNQDSMVHISAPALPKHIKFQSMFGNFSKQQQNHQRSSIGESSKSGGGLSRSQVSLNTHNKKSEASGSTIVQLRGSITFGQHNPSQGSGTSSPNNIMTSERQQAIFNSQTYLDLLLLTSRKKISMGAQGKILSKLSCQKPSQI